ncbi:hypothetical protein PYCCODRAFT_1468255 [Trametes coccinea BRFM310]|uniref:Transmembrane protein n=1 Tax=Trametes coccinea (strain BRFM310) TaxID=1353009 RepID=A0A1Y2ILI2_TRAC3|nr:hypothetical protein PYCCODRAFT_1468255 [Trametes coccinea BRFM310]
MPLTQLASVPTTPSPAQSVQDGQCENNTSTVTIPPSPPADASAPQQSTTPAGSPGFDLASKFSSTSLVAASPAVPVLNALPVLPPSPSDSTSSSSVSSLVPTTPPSMLRRLNSRQSSGDHEEDTRAHSGAPESDSDFEGMLSSFAGWQLKSRPGTPATSANRWLRSTNDRNAGFTRTVHVVKRQQDDIRKVVESLEKELLCVHDKVTESLHASTRMLLRTQELIANERKNMERQHESTANDIRSLETRLTRAQRHIATLQAQHIADKGLIEKLANEIAVLWDHQDDIGCRLQRAEETEQQGRQLAGKLRELMHEIQVRDHEARQDLSTVLPTLQEELARNDFAPSAPTETKPVVLAHNPGVMAVVKLKSIVSCVYAGVKYIGTMLFFLGLAALHRILMGGLRSGLALVSVAARIFDYHCAVVIVVWARFLATRLLITIVVACIVVATSSILYQRLAPPRRESPIWDALAA